MTPGGGSPSRRGRGERGLASHEWLLLIAAAASFTALAVFVLAETVDDAVARAGADDPASRASAERDAALVENEAVTIVPADWKMRLWGEWADYYARRCRNVQNAYRAHGYTVVTAVDTDLPPFKPPSDKSDEDRMIKVIPGPPEVRAFEVGVAEALARADPRPPSLGKPQARCEIE